MSANITVTSEKPSAMVWSLSFSRRAIGAGRILSSRRSGVLLRLKEAVRLGLALWARSRSETCSAASQRTIAEMVAKLRTKNTTDVRVAISGAPTGLKSAKVVVKETRQRGQKI